MPGRRARFPGTLLLAAAMVAPAAARPPAIDPATAARHAAEAFYDFHFTHDQGFTAATVNARREFLSAGLLALARAYLARPATPERVPAIDGDPFTNSQEYPRLCDVGATTAHGTAARATILCRWPDGHGATLTLALRAEAGHWRIDDVLYADGASLRGLLQRP